MSVIVNLVKPVLFSLLESQQVKELVVELLRRYAKSTTNDVDDLIVEAVSNALLKK